MYFLIALSSRQSCWLKKLSSLGLLAYTLFTSLNIKCVHVVPLFWAPTINRLGSLNIRCSNRGTCAHVKRCSHSCCRGKRLPGWSMIRFDVVSDSNSIFFSRWKRPNVLGGYADRLAAVRPPKSHGNIIDRSRRKTCAHRIWKQKSDLSLLPTGNPRREKHATRTLRCAKTTSGSRSLPSDSSLREIQRLCILPYQARWSPTVEVWDSGRGPVRVPGYLGSRGGHKHTEIRTVTARRYENGKSALVS